MSSPSSAIPIWNCHKEGCQKAADVAICTASKYLDSMNEDGNYAAIFDIDETLLMNSEDEEDQMFIITGICMSSKFMTISVRKVEQ